MIFYRFGRHTRSVHEYANVNYVSAHYKVQFDCPKTHFDDVAIHLSICRALQVDLSQTGRELATCRLRSPISSPKTR